MPTRSVNENNLVVTPQRSQEAISGTPILKNIECKKGLLDDLDLELMAKIVAEVTKKLKRSGSGKDEWENKFFHRVGK